METAIYTRLSSGCGQFGMHNIHKISASLDCEEFVQGEGYKGCGYRAHEDHL